ncbi:hypothetical protein RJ55_03533 [Drechmeria coniospora]|nr:hypothetical protein RJ55_03533 [Drechmeria coniospora]
MMLSALCSFVTLALAAAQGLPDAVDAGATAQVPGLIRHPIRVSRTAPPGGKLRRRQVRIDHTTREDGIFYTIDLAIGTPAQTVPVMIDTGSTKLWVNPRCERARNEKLCSSFGRFTSSRTFTDLNKTSHAVYMGSAMARFRHGYDYVQVGPARLSQQIFGVAYDTEDISASILGLGPRLADWLNPYPLLLDNLVGQGFINSRSFSLDIRSLDSKSGSVIFGGVDTKKFRGKLEKRPIIPPPSSLKGSVGYWIHMDGIGVRRADGSAGTVYDKPNGVAIMVDSGSPFNSLPKAVFDDLIKQFPSAQPVSNSSDLYTVPCSVRDSDGHVDFKFGGAVINVPFKDFIFKYDQLCIIGANIAEEYPLLGDSFLRAAYVVFDQDNNNIHLANTHNCGTNLVPIGKGPDGVPSVAGDCMPSSTGSVQPASSTTDGSVQPTSSTTDGSIPTAGPDDMSNITGGSRTNSSIAGSGNNTNSGSGIAGSGIANITNGGIDTPSTTTNSSLSGNIPGSSLGTASNKANGNVTGVDVGITGGTANNSNIPSGSVEPISGNADGKMIGVGIGIVGGDTGGNVPGSNVAPIDGSVDGKKIGPDDGTVGGGTNSSIPGGKPTSIEPVDNSVPGKKIGIDAGTINGGTDSAIPGVKPNSAEPVDNSVDGKKIGVDDGSVVKPNGSVEPIDGSIDGNTIGVDDGIVGSGTKSNVPGSNAEPIGGSINGNLIGVDVGIIGGEVDKNVPDGKVDNNVPDGKVDNNVPDGKVDNNVPGGDTRSAGRLPIGDGLPSPNGAPRTPLTSTFTSVSVETICPPHVSGCPGSHVLSRTTTGTSVWYPDASLAPSMAPPSPSLPAVKYSSSTYTITDCHGKQSCKVGDVSTEVAKSTQLPSPNNPSVYASTKIYTITDCRGKGPCSVGQLTTELLGSSTLVSPVPSATAANTVPPMVPPPAPDAKSVYTISTASTITDCGGKGPCTMRGVTTQVVALTASVCPQTTATWTIPVDSVCLEPDVGCKPGEKKSSYFVAVVTPVTPAPTPIPIPGSEDGNSPLQDPQDPVASLGTSSPAPTPAYSGAASRRRAPGIAALALFSLAIVLA